MKETKTTDNGNIVKAFENIPEIFFRQSEINIIDYGRQGFGALCYVDFLRSKLIPQSIKKVTLIEQSEIYLKRAVEEVSSLLPDAEIVTVNKTIEDLSNNDIACDEKIPTLHILSNVFEMLFDIGNFGMVISDNLKGYNQFACAERYNPATEELWLYYFSGLFYDPEPKYSFDKKTTTPFWEHILCFSIGEFEEDVSTEVTEDKRFLNKKTL